MPVLPQSLLNRLPIVIGTGDKIWAVEGARIEDIDSSKTRSIVMTAPTTPTEAPA